MIEIRETDVFQKWFRSLKDKRTKAIVDVRIRRVSLGNFGDVESVGEGVSELRIDYGSGYRIYFVNRGNVFVILLCGGTKSTQSKDIKKAKEIARDIEEHLK